MLAPRETNRVSRELRLFAVVTSAWLTSEKVLFWEVSEETWERVSVETLWYCYMALGLMEPDERNCSYFSWSNSMTNDSTADPRSLRLTCTATFISVEKEFSSRLIIFYLVKKFQLQSSLRRWKLQQNNSDYKREEGLSGSPLCLKPSSLYSDRRWSCLPLMSWVSSMIFGFSLWITDEVRSFSQWLK